MRKLSALLVALVALQAPAGALAASCPRTTSGALENEVMCQVCGVPLALAGDAPEAKRVRALIARLVARCETKGQIKQELVAQLGPSVLAEPPHQGFDLAAYLVPALAVALGAAGLGSLGVAWRRRRHAPAVASDVPTLSAADRARVEAALERWEP